MSELSYPELIVRCLQGNADLEQEDQLRKWRAESAAHEDAHAEIARLWHLTGRVERGAGSVPPPVEELMLRAAPAHVSRQKSLARLLARPGLYVPATAAAMFMFGVGVSSRWLRPAPVSASRVEFATGLWEMSTVRLNDSTEVRLAPNSRLRVGSVEREVWLDGHAFFAVTRRPGRRFVVHTSVGNAVVLGTRFDLRVENDSLRLVVVEGRVALSTPNNRLEIGESYMSRVQAGASPRLEKVKDMTPVLAWMGKSLTFRSTPLKQVAREIEQRYDVTVHLADSAVAARTVSASFSEASLPTVITVVCRVTSAHCVLKGSTVTITR